MNKINELTKEQEALIPIYREKWKKIAFSTSKNDEYFAIQYIKRAYKYLNLYI